MHSGVFEMLEHRRAYVVLTVFLCIVSICSRGVVAHVLMPWEEASLSTVTLVVDGVDVPVYFGGSTYYISDANKYGRKYPLYVAADKNVANRLIGIGDTVYEAEFSSSDPSVASIDDHGIIAFWSEGSVTSTVKIGSSAGAIDVDVREAPFIIDIMANEIPTTEDVVRKLGMPDSITSSRVTWPHRSAGLDNIFYAFGGTADVNVVHWHFSEFPTLFFRVVDNKRIVAIHNKGSDCGYSLTMPYHLGIDS